MSTTVLFALQNQLKSQLKKRFGAENGERLLRALHLNSSTKTPLRVFLSVPEGGIRKKWITAARPKDQVSLANVSEFIPSQSELVLFIPIFVSEPMRIIANQSEKRFVTRLMNNGKKSIQTNPH